MESSNGSSQSKDGAITSFLNMPMMGMPAGMNLPYGMNLPSTMNFPFSTDPLGGNSGTNYNDEVMKVRFRPGVRYLKLTMA